MTEETKIDDGGPAFPVVEVHPVHGSRVDMGMTLRDWFAGQALSHAYLQWIPGGRDLDMASAHMAQECYMIADAMLKARKQ